MAVKDHSLDEKIVKAAKEEFLKYGYQKASLHQIVKKAGITTGALYTRYENKDDLFSSLVKDFLKRIAEEFEPLKSNYLDAGDNPTVDEIIAAIRAEEKAYLDILFENYDECILFICESDGSSIEKMMKELMDYKAKETIAYLKSKAKRDINYNGVEFIIYQQFNYYRLILEKGYTKEEAYSCLETVENFLEAGWKDLFERIL